MDRNLGHTFVIPHNRHHFVSKKIFLKEQNRLIAFMALEEFFS